MIWFPSAKCFHLASLALDHSPLSLRLLPKPWKRKVGKLFCFESMWLKDPRCEEIVQETWGEGLAKSSNYALGKCLDRCRIRLKAWNKVEFGHVERTIAELQKHLEWLELQPPSPVIIRDVRTTRIE